MNNYLKKIALSSINYKPRIFGIDDALIVGLVALVGTITSASMQSSAAKKNQASQINAMNTTNALSSQQWGAEMAQRDKEFNRKMRFDQKSQLENFINSSPLLKKEWIGIWGGQ